MKIRKFQADNFRRALSLVKREMGEDAVILATEELKGCVEVTAAVDYDLEHAGGLQGSKNFEGGGMPRETGGSGYADDIRDLKREVGALKEALLLMRKSGYALTMPEGRREVVDYLRKRAVRNELSLKISGKCSSLKELAGSIAGDIRTCGDVEGKKIKMLVGPTGVGKTTTAAKLTARSLKKGKKTAVISLDTCRIGAVEQMRVYSRIMEIPFDVASSPEELKKGLRKYSDRDLVLIDTTGRNPRENGHIEDLLPVYDLGFPVETHLLLSANSDYYFMVQACRQYGRLPVDCISFTKTDEAARFGSIYNISSLCRKPVAYITTGQRVPQDIEFPDSGMLAKMILGNGVKE